MWLRSSIDHLESLESASQTEQVFVTSEVTQRPIIIDVVLINERITGEFFQWRRREMTASGVASRWLVKDEVHGRQTTSLALGTRSPHESTNHSHYNQSFLCVLYTFSLFSVISSLVVMCFTFHVCFTPRVTASVICTLNDYLITYISSRLVVLNGESLH